MVSRDITGTRNTPAFSSLDEFIRVIDSIDASIPDSMVNELPEKKEEPMRELLWYERAALALQAVHYCSVPPILAERNWRNVAARLHIGPGDRVMYALQCGLAATTKSALITLDELKRGINVVDVPEEPNEVLARLVKGAVEYLEGKKAYLVAINVHRARKPGHRYYVHMAVHAPPGSNIEPNRVDVVAGFALNLGAKVKDLYVDAFTNALTLAELTLLI